MLLVIVEFTLISRPPKVIAVYVFAQYFFLLFWLVGWLVYVGKVAGMLVHLGNLVLGCEVTQAPAGGFRANNVRWTDSS